MTEKLDETVASAADLGLSTEQLIAALRRSAKGLYTSEAAVEVFGAASILRAMAEAETALAEAQRLLLAGDA